MDLNAPDTDIPDVYRGSAVPISINPADVNAAHQAVLASLMQTYPVSPADNLSGMDAQTRLRMIMNLLQRPPQMLNTASQPGQPLPMPAQPQAAAPTPLATGLQ